MLPPKLHVFAYNESGMQGFPEALFVHLLKIMAYPNVVTRIGAHRIFVVLLSANCNKRHTTASLGCGLHLEQQKWHTDRAVHSSIASLLEKLRKEKDGDQSSNNIGNAVDFCNEKNTVDDKKQVCSQINSSNLYKISSIIDKTTAEAVRILAEF